MRIQLLMLIVAQVALWCWAMRPMAPISERLIVMLFYASLSVATLRDLARSTCKALEESS